RRRDRLQPHPGREAQQVRPRRPGRLPRPVRPGRRPRPGVRAEHGRLLPAEGRPMTLARVRLVVAAAPFVGWLAWLGYAVSRKGTVQIVSRAQLTAATYLVVAEVATGEDGQPLPKARVIEVLRAPDGD